MTFIPIKKEITVGQIIGGLLFLFGLAVGWGATKNELESNTKTLEKHINTESSEIKELVRREELAAELRGLHQELSDLKLIVYSSITKRQLTATEKGRIEQSIDRADGR